MRDHRLAKLADLLVNFSVRVRKWDVIQLSGATVTQPRIVEIFRNVVEAGGHALIRMKPDEIAAILYKRGSDEQLTWLSPFAVYETERSFPAVHRGREVQDVVFDEKIGGTVHFALGAGYPETGNTNQSGLHWDMVMDLRQGGRIEIDGVTIRENGKFNLEGFPV